MSDIEEVKTLFAETQRVAEAAKKKVEELAGKSADYVASAELKRIQDDLGAKFAAQDAANAKIADRLEKAETLQARPRSVEVGASAEFKDMDGYLRKGVEPAEQKAMSTGIGADGGFMIPTVTRAEIERRLRASSPMRRLATTVAFNGSSYDVLVERDDIGFEWAGEVQARSETTTPTINRISITAHELSAMPKVSQRMLDDTSFPLENWLTERLADRFMRAEATAFVSGTGNDRPKGILSYALATTADETRAAETLQYRPSGASGAFASTGPGDVLVRAFYDLKGEYQDRASWMMKNTTMAVVATLKGGDGAYLLQNMLSPEGQFVRVIQGRPAYLAEDMPEIAANSYSIAFGDFSRYTIVDSASIRILRDQFSAKPNVLFYATKRVGGGVTNFDAIKFIRFGTA